MKKIHLCVHQPVWAAIFEQEKALLEDTFTGKIVVAHHVGSTAVPELLAKPVIDIALETDLYPPSADTIAKMKVLGYTYRGEAGVAGRVWFTKGTPRKVNLHLCPIDSPVVRRQIRFRDLLRMDQQLRKNYQALKLRNYLGKDIDDADYANSKSLLINNALNGNDQYR